MEFGYGRADGATQQYKSAFNIFGKNIKLRN